MSWFSGPLGCFGGPLSLWREPPELLQWTPKVVYWTPYMFQWAPNLYESRVANHMHLIHKMQPWGHKLSQKATQNIFSRETTKKIVVFERIIRV